MSMDLQQLRACLLEQPQTGAVVIEDGADNLTLTPAAVLFPIVVRDAGHTVMLTQRTAHLRDHAGQISFPGGRVEPQDVSPAATALREAEEEVGLDPARVEVVGYLPVYRTVTGFCVTPVVAIVKPPVDLRPDPGEVADVFEVPLSFLLDSANHQRCTMQFEGRQRDFYAVPYGDRYIWGATAGIILGLARLLSLR